MQNSPPIFVLLLILAGACGVVAVVSGRRLQPGASSRVITLAAILPGLVMAGLFYSLAIHMRQSLGAWPASLGTRGFPSPLITHADIAGQYFSVLLLICMFGWPVACVLSALIRRWKGALFYLGVFALSCSVCFGTMLLAPSGFLYWWWD